jgi:MFS family permease
VSLTQQPKAVGGGGVNQRVVYPWPFFVALASTFLLFFSFQALFPISPLYIVEVGGSSTDNGLATWVFALAALLTRSLAGVLSDRWGRKPVLVLGAVLLGSGPALHALASTMPLLLAVKAFHGVGLGCFSTAYQAFTADLLPPGRYGEGLGVANTGPVAAMVVAPLFGEWLVGRLDFTYSFLAFGAIGGLGFLTTLVLPGRGAASSQEALSTDGSLREALRQPGVRVGSFGMALLGVPFGAFISFVPLLTSARNLGGTGLVFSVYALAGALVRPVAGRVTDRWGARRVALLGLVLLGLAAGGLAVVAGRWTLMGFAVLLGVGGAMAIAALDAKVQASVGQSLRGSAAAIQYTALDLLVGFGTLGLGFLADTAGYGVMYGVVSGVVLLGVLIGALALKRLSA